jgi:hypothetical protein
LLVAALLLCHGIYGYEHQLANGSDLRVAHTTHAGSMGTHHTSSEEGGGSTSHHEKAAGGYFAVLISVLLGAFRWSWRRSFWVLAVPLKRRITNRFVAPHVPCPPRGPSLYLFQVIRL